LTSITARRVYRDNITFHATHSLFTTPNYVPVVSETDHGTWRRLAMLKFPYTFRRPGESLDTENDRVDDPTLKERIKHNTDGQHDAIVTWAIEGAVKWDANPATSLQLTNTVKADTHAWRAEADRIMGFWDEHLTPDSGYRILTTEMHEIFNSWLRGNGNQEWPKETVNIVGGVNWSTPRHLEYDLDHAFAYVNKPQVLAEGWSLEVTTPLPAPKIPVDPMEKLVWFCTTAQPAEPWLPTVAQQDGAWLTLFGPRLEVIRAQQWPVGQAV
jgi:hypothetical protein